MNALMINGGPHKEGNTLHEFLKQKNIDAKILRVENKNIRGCISCYSCIETENCVLHDIVNETLLSLSCIHQQSI